jgi:FtsP/CotA-like multicopper oxidase with cupredoxin domain
MKHSFKYPVNRRSLLSHGAALVGGTTLAGVSSANSARSQAKSATHQHVQAGEMITIGDVDATINGFDPTILLTDWDTGTVGIDEEGKPLRIFEVEAIDKDIEIAPGVIFPAWTFNGRIPGPTLRATEGERLRINFKNNGSRHHSLHFHGIHSARMDGISADNGLIPPGDEFVYEFSATPFGCHLYHCHALPLRHHMHKGMYGAFIIDPDPEKHIDEADIARSRKLGTAENSQWQELVMVMNAFDTSFDGENEFYAVNTVAHHYMKHPIAIDKSRPVRIYLVNVTEFDPINSFHLHANFFDYFDHGTTLTPTLRTVDTIMQCQAQRGILEFSFKDHDSGKYMFHAHQAEFAELGWMAMFDVQEASS